MIRVVCVKIYDIAALLMFRLLECLCMNVENGQAQWSTGSQETPSRPG